jgi:hypothetical protein
MSALGRFCCTDHIECFKRRRCVFRKRMWGTTSAASESTKRVLNRFKAAIRFDRRCPWYFGRIPTTLNLRFFNRIGHKHARLGPQRRVAVRDPLVERMFSAELSKLVPSIVNVRRAFISYIGFSHGRPRAHTPRCPRRNPFSFTQ